MTHSGWYEEQILVLVKAYPQPSQKYNEAVCVAGVTSDNKWIRLYPVKYRNLSEKVQFKKWTWIKCNILKSKDYRPESYKFDHDSIEILTTIGTKNNWQERRKILSSLDVGSLEKLEILHKNDRVSLGYIRPKEITSFLFEETTPNWDKKNLEALKRDKQPRLFSPRIINKKLLEKIPYKFFYVFTCNDSNCKGHKLQVLDWEVSQSFRKWRKDYGAESTALDMMRQKYMEEFVEIKDLGFVLGTIFSVDRFGTFSIIGLVYPPKQKIEQLSFF